MEPRVRHRITGDNWRTHVLLAWERTYSIAPLDGDPATSDLWGVYIAYDGQEPIYTHLATSRDRAIEWVNLLAPLTAHLVRRYDCACERTGRECPACEHRRTMSEAERHELLATGHA